MSVGYVNMRFSGGIYHYATKLLSLQPKFSEVQTFRAEKE